MLDHAQAILTFVDPIAEKTLSSTATLTAARGQGKSAALGLAIATALVHGYSNIFVTGSSPKNLKTLFDFIFEGMDALGYEEHLEYCTTLISINHTCGEYSDIGMLYTSDKNSLQSMPQTSIENALRDDCLRLEIELSKVQNNDSTTITAKSRCFAAKRFFKNIFSIHREPE